MTDGKQDGMVRLSSLIGDPEKLLEAVLDRQTNRRGQHPARRVVQEKNTEVAEIVHLPLWPNGDRACPSCILRSALYGVVQRGRRRYLDNEILASWSDSTIRYQGQQLDQADLDVFLYCIELSKKQGLGARIEFSEYQFLKAIGRVSGKRKPRPGGTQYEWLNASFRRHIACATTIVVNGKEYTGNLIADFYRHPQTGRYVMFLNPRLLMLFREGYTRVDWEVRQALRMDLAKWLHSYIESHQATTKTPHRIALERLRELCQSEIVRLRDFRAKIREAMIELKAVKVVIFWQITDNDALEFVRPRKRQQTIEK